MSNSWILAWFTLVEMQLKTWNILPKYQYLSYSLSKGSSSNFASNIKARLSLSKNFAFIYCNESTLKMMKNAFYFMLKALLVI